MSREEIEQVEKELDEVLEIVQRPVPVKNTGREKIYRKMIPYRKKCK